MVTGINQDGTDQPQETRTPTSRSALQAEASDSLAILST